jgi:hypothetical protein
MNRRASELLIDRHARRYYSFESIGHNIKGDGYKETDTAEMPDRTFSLMLGKPHYGGAIPHLAHRGLHQSRTATRCSPTLASLT